MRSPAGIVLAMGLAAASGARGQAAPHGLTLSDAWELAERHHPDLAVARNGVRAAVAEGLAARAAFLPDVRVSTGFDVTRFRRFTSTDDFGDPAEREEAVETTARGASQGLLLDWTIFDGGTALAGRRAATARRREAEAALEAARRRVQAEVARAYLDLLERRRMLDVERANLDARRRDVATTRRLFPIVAADRIDVLGAEIALRRQEAAVAAAEEAALAGGLELAQAAGTAIDPGSRLEAPREPFDPDSMDVEGLVRAALSDHPVLRELAARAEAAGAEAWDDGWPAYLPEIAAGASYLRSEFGGPTQPFFHLDPRDTAASFGLRLTLPLFDRFARHAARARAQAAAADAAAALRAGRLEVETAVRSRFLGLRSAWRSLEIEAETASMARERAGLAREMYEAGGIDYTRLQPILDDASNAGRGLVQRRFDYYRALVELERVAGRTVAPPGG